MCSRQRGVSLVELIIFIVVVGVAVLGVVGALRLGTSASADPMVQKQALSIAEALLEEVQLQPFTYCDPDDANAAAAIDATQCTGGANGPNDENRLPLGPEGTEARGSTTTPFDNVSDYNGLSLPSPPGITGIDGTGVAGLEAYSATIAVTNQALGVVPASDALLIRVTVNGPPGTNTTVVLDGYRVRYAPNALP
jgi:MSHA pilin protein MshD